jgi:hypothetical protein
VKTKIFRAVLPAVLILMACLTSCSKAKEIVAWDYTYTLPRISFSYPPITLKSGELVLYSGPYTLNLDSLLHANGVSSGVIGPTYFTKCSVSIDQPADANFAWLQSSRIEISGAASFDSVQEIGHVTDIDPAAKTIAYTMNHTNIRPYLGSNGFYLRLFGTLKAKQPLPVIRMYIDGQVVLRLQPLN